MKAYIVFLFLSCSQFALPSVACLHPNHIKHDKCNSFSEYLFPGIEKMGLDRWYYNRSFNQTHFPKIGGRRVIFIDYKPASMELLSLPKLNFYIGQNEKGIRFSIERFVQTEMNLSLRAKKKHWVFHHTSLEFKMNRHRNKHLFFTARINLF